MAPLFSLAIFLGSFLLFIIQPVLVKSLLPQVGGAPAIWVTSILFFQILLLAGYAYASVSSLYLTAKRQSQLHLGLLFLALIFTLPLSLQYSGQLPQSIPEYWIVVTLLFTVGLPYFLLASNATLLQRWYYQANGTSPYFLFSISNAGSLAGLLSYPLLIEWLFPLKEQMLSWSYLFYGLILLLTLTTLKLRHIRTQTESLHTSFALNSSSILRILFLGFIPSALFLSTTLFITTDIATIPLLWVLPLALYLLSFIIAFSNNAARWISLAQHLHLPICALVFLLAGYVYAFLSHFYAKNYYMEQVALHLLCLFIISLSCHGQIAKEKPAPEALTSYYFWLALGGALGALFANIAPYLFNDIYEYPIILILSLSVPFTYWFKNHHQFSTLRKAAFAGSTSCIVLALIITWTESDDYQAQYQARNFFGVKKVAEKASPFFVRILEIGSTKQGYQPTFPGHELYLNHNLRNLMENTPSGFFEQPFAVIGLGTGMLTCMASENQIIDFYEIDPLVAEIAQNSDYFTYLRDCPGKPNLILGDGRLEIRKQSNEKYNLIVLDAFNSSAIPMHLLTKEALGIYLSKLNPQNGLLAFNIIARHTDLRPILARLAKEYNMAVYHKRFEYNPEFSYDGTAEWIFMAKPNSHWDEQFTKMNFTSLKAAPDSPLWTDHRSSILSVLK